MKKESARFYKIIKIIQLIVLIALFIVFFIYIKADPNLNSIISANTKLFSIIVCMCAFMIFSFVCIVLDLRQLAKNITDNDVLNKLAYLDTLTGIPNRISCDLMFQNYDNAPLDVIEKLGCSLISITNLALINEALGREKGNYLIQDFAMLFDRVGSKYGFVGRNGGNEFLIVIENCDSVKMQKFLDDLSNEVKHYNENSNHMPVTYKSCSVFNSELKKPVFADVITQLYKERGNK